MRLLFICGSLEMGRDGVGDYTRRLATQLIMRGHFVSLLAINDSFINENVSEGQIFDGVEVEVMRLPSSRFEIDNFKIAKLYITKIDPNYISLQFVPFAFHKKGLPYKLIENLIEIGQGRRWHIMFHELWVGMNTSASAKLRFLSIIQKNIIKNIIKKLNPIISTHVEVYRSQLLLMGFQVNLLPLFSNVLKKNNEVSLTPRNVTKNIRFVVFGTIHPRTPIFEFANEVAKYAKQNNIDINLTFLGRCGAEEETWINIWRGEGLNCESIGEQPQDKISAILSNSTIGISTTPLELIGKSGSAAAMREHGLNIICVCDKWIPRNIPSTLAPSGVTEYKSGHLEQYFTEFSNELQAADIVSEVCAKMESMLNQ